MGWLETIGNTIWLGIKPLVETKFNELWPNIKKSIEDKFDEFLPIILDKIMAKLDEFLPKILKAVVLAIMQAFSSAAVHGADKITDMIPGELDDKIVDPIVEDVFRRLKEFKFGL